MTKFQKFSHFCRGFQLGINDYRIEFNRGDAEVFSRYMPAYIMLSVIATAIGAFTGGFFAAVLGFIACAACWAWVISPLIHGTVMGIKNVQAHNKTFSEHCQSNAKGSKQLLPSLYKRLCSGSKIQFKASNKSTKAKNASSYNGFFCKLVACKKSDETQLNTKEKKF